MLRFIILIAVILSAVNCRTTQRTIHEVGVHPVQLEPLARNQYQILGDVKGYAKKSRVFFMTFGDDANGTIAGHQEEPGYRFLKVTMCWVSLGLVCHNYPLNARDAAVYNAITSMKDADALIEVKHERFIIDYYFYQKVDDIVTAKAIRFLPDDELGKSGMNGAAAKKRSDEDDEDNE